MNRTAWELWIALSLIAAVAGGYAVAARSAVPSPSGTIGITLGIIGFALMVKTETVYTLRKKVRGFTRGRTAFWLQFHIVTGLVGPFLVLLHTGWRFQGLAGTAALLLGTVVLSGFVGRYIYTAIPRTLRGTELSGEDFQSLLDSIDRELAERTGDIVQHPLGPPDWPDALIVVGRPWLMRRYRRLVHRSLARPRRQNPSAVRVVERLMVQRYRLLLQWRTLTAARRLMALWHLAHVPLGGVMFVTAILHIGGALYYGLRIR